MRAVLHLLRQGGQVPPLAAQSGRGACIRKGWNVRWKVPHAVGAVTLRAGWVRPWWGVSGDLQELGWDGVGRGKVLRWRGQNAKAGVVSGSSTLWDLETESNCGVQELGLCWSWGREGASLDLEGRDPGSQGGSFTLTHRGTPFSVHFMDSEEKGDKGH